jgi:hypothetical protein
MDSDPRPVNIPVDARPRRGRQLEIALFAIVVVVATAMIVATTLIRHGRQERAAVRRAWKLGTVVLFEGDEYYANPPFSPAEWDADLRRSPLDDALAASPIEIQFVRFTPFVKWPEPIVDDGDISELIEILRQLPTVKSVKLDENITAAGRTRLMDGLPGVRFR